MWRGGGGARKGERSQKHKEIEGVMKRCWRDEH